MPPQNQQPTQPAPPQYPTQPSPATSLPIGKPPKSGPPKALIIAPIVVLVLLLIGAVVFGLQMQSQRDDYRDNVQQKVDAAVETANAELTEELEADFLEREKSPYRRYESPSQFGAVQIDYPKTWSAYVDETATGNTPLSGLFHPSFVPGERSGTAFALKLEVIEEPYDGVLEDYESDARQGTVRISPYTAPNVPSVLGARVDGELERDYRGSAVLFPLRDKTIRISTLSPQFIPDFNNIILENLVFTP